MALNLLYTCTCTLNISLSLYLFLCWLEMLWMNKFEGEKGVLDFLYILKRIEADS